MRERLRSHFSIGTSLSLMSDKKLGALLSKAKLTKGWGQNGILKIDGQRIFVKKIPLTDLEVANAYSTKNLYRIPSWYSYGIGSAGFGAFRELAAHVKTTNWVRDGQSAAFPLLHHHRIVTTKVGNPGISDLKGYVAYWNGSKTIERYMMDRKECKHHLVLFLEYLTPLSEWMADNPVNGGGMFPKAIKVVDFLKKNGMIHFDAHLYNWLTDGKNVFLADFGLSLDREFELTKSEMDFFKHHRDYDYAQVIDTFGSTLMENHFSVYTSQAELVKKVLEKLPNQNIPRLTLWMSTVLALHYEKQIRLPAPLVKYIRRYQPIIDVKNEFFRDICKGKKTVDRYPNRKLRKLLRQLEVID